MTLTGLQDILASISAAYLSIELSLHLLTFDLQNKILLKEANGGLIDMESENMIKGITTIPVLKKRNSPILPSKLSQTSIGTDSMFNP